MCSRTCESSSDARDHVICQVNMSGSDFVLCLDRAYRFLLRGLFLVGSFYIHRSVFTDGDKSSWRIDSPSQIDTTIYPLLTLFKLLKVNPFQKVYHSTNHGCLIKVSFFFQSLGVVTNIIHVTIYRLSLNQRILIPANAPWTWKYVLF